MTQELQSTLEASGIEWRAMRNHIPCMAHINQLALGGFMCSLGVKVWTKSWEAHERDQQFGENHSTNIGNSQRLQKKGNARNNKVLAMRPRIAKIIEKVRISCHFERPETDLHIAPNACCIDYVDTCSLKLVHWLSTSQSTNHNTTHYGYGNTVEFNNGVAWVSLLITRIHRKEGQVSKIQWLPATLHNTGWLDHREEHPGSFKAISILDPVDVEMA